MKYPSHGSYIPKGFFQSFKIIQLDSCSQVEMILSCREHLVMAETILFDKAGAKGSVFGLCPGWVEARDAVKQSIMQRTALEYLSNPKSQQNCH
jgi:hypothetical protein